MNTLLIKHQLIISSFLMLHFSCCLDAHTEMYNEEGDVFHSAVKIVK